MSVSPHDGGVQSSGLIIPENIPGDDLKPSRLEEVARTLRTSGSGAVEQAETAESTWSGLPGVLESPQGPVIYAALGTPSTAARAVDAKFTRVADALDDFAASLRPIKDEFAAIKQDAVAFRATITWDERVWVSPQETKEYEGNALTQVSSSSYTTSYSQPRTLTEVLDYLRGRGETARSVGGRAQILAHWTESSEHIDQNNVLMDRLADAYAKLQNAEADCANAINRQRETCMAEVEYIEAWQLKQSDELTVVMPWGSRVDEDRNCGESFWWGAGNAGKEALEGFGGLFGYNSLIDGWEWDKSWQTAGESWWGVVTGLGSLLVITSPPLMLLGMAGVPVLKDGVATGQEMVKGLLAWDTWAENPAEAAGRVVVNVGSIFIPGAGAASAAIKALTAGSHIIDLAGDASRLTHAADTGVTKVDGLLPHLDGLASEVAGAGGVVDDLVGVGSKIDMPDSSLLHVGTRTPDAPPPGSLLDDAAGSGYPPRRPGDGGPLAGATDDGPPRRPDDGDGPRGGAADDPPPPRKPDDDDPPPPRADDDPPPQRTPDDPPPPRPDDGDDLAPGSDPDAPSRPPLHPDDPGWHPRMDPEKGNNPDGTWDGKPGHHLDADDNAAVQRYAAESVGIEQSIRPALLGIVDDVAPGSRLVGGADAIKFADSLKDKVADLFGENPGLLVDDALEQVKDSVRYTVEAGVGDYTSTVVSVVERLRAEGYELVKFTDSWASPGYKGVNSSWMDSATGRIFEVQFHTAESFIRKTEGHGDYELLRDATLSQDEIARITRANEEWFADLEIPPGAGNLGDLFKPDGTPHVRS